MSGAIHDVGIFRLPVIYVQLGARKASLFGNGCPSEWVTYNLETVACVDVDERRYILQENTGDSVATRKITVHHDADLNNLDQMPCPTCGAVKTDHIRS
jgi:hypothetical protein